MSETLPTMPREPGATQGYTLLREACALVDLPDVTLLEMRGKDRKGWLQGQVTNDLRALRTGGSLAFCLASPTGQLEAICRVWDLPERYVIATSTPAAVEARVEKLVILEDVEVQRLPGRLLSLQGPEATRRLSELVRLPALDAHEFELGLVLRSDRTGYGGWDILPVEGADLGSFDRADADALALAGLEAGVPIFGLDTDGKTLPPELGFAFVAEHISYTKGCYTGQEVIHRLHARGHTNRTWVGLLCDAPVSAGDAVQHRARKDGGRVTRSGESPMFGPIAAAMVRNELAEVGTLVEVVGAEGAVRAEVVAMPILRLD